MITEEQIKNLKPGDPLLIECTFNDVYDDGDICINVKESDVFSDDVITNTKYVHPSCVSLPSPYPPLNLPIVTEVPQTYPKYDPCRLFRKRDKVEVVANKGRTHIGCHGYVGNVTKDEDEMGQVMLNLERAGVMVINAAYLQLVTPVEELEPFNIHHTDDNEFYIYFKDDLPVASYPYKGEGYPYYYTKEQARERAEAECARLNAEWRKEQA